MSELKFHPLADLFPLMEGEDFDALVADIKANGLHLPIELYDGMVLDGRNRYRAVRALGWHPDQIELQTLTAGPSGSDTDLRVDDPVAHVISKNIHRRHLTAEQKRELIAKLLKAKPEASNNAIAKRVKTDDKTVASVRREMEGRSEIPNVETRTDTKGRKQPARKPPKQVERELEAAQAHNAELEAAREHDQGLAEKLRAAELRIVGLEGEIEDLKRENADLRAQLDAARGKSIDATAPKKPGRPKGSKNKPKPTAAGIVMPVTGNDPGLIPECLRREPKAVSS